MNAYFTAMRRYFDFSGRSTRSEYWLFTLVFIILGVVGMMIDGALLGEPGPVTAVIILAHLLPSLSVSVRRLHDVDRTGWWVLINLIPFGIIVLTVFLCAPSTPSTNRFGMPGPADGNRVQPPSLATSTGGQMPNPAHIDQLEKLAALRSSGAIDETEFQRLKANLLARSFG